MNQDVKHICIAGSGTAGLLTALMLRSAFPAIDITVVSSSKKGIIGVGEGSTEHWREFMRLTQIPVNELIAATAATHKYGIRFEGWSNSFPDYFHSVAGDEELYAYGLYPTYMGFIERGKLLTNQTTSIGLWKDKIRRVNLHENTNQYHFDTFKLNEYMTLLCFRRRIVMRDGDIAGIERDTDTGCVTSLVLDDNEKISADFFIDATGFSREIMKRLEGMKWTSFSKYLLGNAAIAFPTESDPSGKIKSYTRARAAKSGWMWEIPTQYRRGNGYVYSSDFLTEEEAVKEAEQMTGYTISENHRAFSFDPGYLENQWVKNCCAIGLASSFVEPLEATSIGSTIQQVKLLIPNLSSFRQSNTAMQADYNKRMTIMMDNILSMIRLHYMVDTNKSDFWRAATAMPVNDSLANLLALWKERAPSRYDISSNNGEMFVAAHMIHVAQGQGLLNKDACRQSIDMFNLRTAVDADMAKRQSSRHDHELVDHAEALKELHEYDI